MEDAQILEERAAQFREAILDVANGPGGMIVAFSRFDTKKPLQPSDFEDTPYWYYAMDSAWSGHIHSPRPTLAEWWYGEDTLWITGWFLWSQMLRYKATGEQEALDTAKKCFLDLHNIFRLDSELETGALGKPHGARPGITTSLDQSADPVLFYAWYARDYASPELKTEAFENLRQHGLWYLRRNMIVNHHGHLANFVGDPHPSSMKYLAAMYVCYELTGEEDVKNTVVKYLKKIVDADILPWNSNPWDTDNYNLTYWGLLCDYWSQTDLASMADWKGYLREYWNAAKVIMDENGIIRSGNYNTVERTFTPHKDGWVDIPETIRKERGFPDYLRRFWVSSTHTPARTMHAVGLAYLGLLARAHGLDDNAHIQAKKTLLSLNEDTLREWYHWGDENKLPDELKPLRNIFAPHGAAIWLMAYWMGRLQGVW